MKQVSPRRVGLRFTWCSIVVRVRMHPGQVPEDWVKAAEALSHQWRVHRVRVTSEQPGFVTLTGLGFDPLRFPPQPHDDDGPNLGGPWLLAPTPANGSGLALSDMVVVREALRVDVGTQEDGRSSSVDLSTRPHWLVTGATMSGKSTWVVRFLSELLCRPVALVGIDCKGGLELSPFGPRLSALATSRGEAAAALEALNGELDLRMIMCSDLHVRSVWELEPDVRPYPVVVVVDEIAELFMSADKAGKDEAQRCVTALVRLAQLGRALGIHLVVAGQRFGSELGSGATLLRAQLGGRVCHRVNDAETAGMTLAGLPAEAIEEAGNIGADMAGVAVAGDDSGEWFLGRSYPTSVARAADLAVRYAALTVPMPEITACIRAVAIGGGRS